MALQLTALTPSLTGTLQYSTGVTAFTFSISSRVNLCWNHSLLRHQQGIWLLVTRTPQRRLSSPNPNPRAQQLLPHHSAQLQPLGCNHPLTLWKKQLIAHPYGSLAISDSPQLKWGTHVAPKLRIIHEDSASPCTHQQPRTSLGKGWRGSPSLCRGLRWAGTSTAQPCYSVKESSPPLVHMRYIQRVLSPRYKHDWLRRETPGKPQTFQMSFSHAAAASSAEGHTTSHQQNIT